MTTTRKIEGKFERTVGGYTRKISENTSIFVPEICAASYDDDTGDLYGYAPDYEAIEAAKSPAVQADKPGEYAYYYETQHAPEGCDFSAQLSYYGEHYHLKPLHGGIERLVGRGIEYDAKYNKYTVTRRAYEKIKQQYKIKYEMCFD